MPWSYQEIIGAGYESGRDFAVGTGNIDNIERCLLVSPHGGSIEPGTTDVMLAVTNLGQWAYYNFQGQLPRRNWPELHIPSTHFDEPRLLGLLPRTRFAVSFHGENSEERRIIHVGGLYDQGRQTFVLCLNEDLVDLRITILDASKAGNDNIAGQSPRNITNRGLRGAGVQLEFSHGTRQLLFRNLNRSNRRRPTENLGVVARSINQALLKLTVRGRDARF